MSNFRRLLFFLSLFTVFSGHLSAEFSANVTEAPVGSSVTLTWSSSASSCSALGEWSGTKSGSGSEAVNVPSLGWNMYGIGCNYIYEYVWVWGTQASTNSAPTINGLPSSVSVQENQTAVTTVSASDSDGDALTYSLSGSDSGSLSISTSGVITFNSAPDYETKNSYSITVNVSDGTATTSKTLTINITDVDEAGGSTSSSNASLTGGYYHYCVIDDSGVVCWGNNSSGQTDVPVLSNPKQVQATPYMTCALDDNGVVCWDDYDDDILQVPSLVNPTMLTKTKAGFICALDDTGMVCWGRTDGVGSGVRTDLDPISYSLSSFNGCGIKEGNVICWGIWSSVTSNVPLLSNPIQVSADSFYACALDDNGVQCWGELSSSASYGQTDVPYLSNPTQIRVHVDHACAIDDTGVVCWGRDVTGVTNPPNLSNPKDLALGHLSACAIDDTGVVCWGWNNYEQTNVPSLSFTNTSSGNSAPVILSASSILVAENTTAVATVSASDSDGDTLTYTLSGTDSGAFSISSSGVITFNSAPDYETKNTYSITVNVSDGTVTTSQALTINITDVEESSGSSSITVSTGAEVSLAFKTAPDYENPQDANQDNYYKVTVNVSDGQETISREITVRIDDVQD